MTLQNDYSNPITPPDELLQCLQRFHICLHPDWIPDCIDFISTDRPEYLNNNHHLTIEVMRHFMRSDFRDGLTRPSLPPNVTQLHNVEVKNLLLQILDIEEVGVSNYTLLDQLRNPDVKQGGKIKLSRSMLKIELTDGYQIIEGMEYTPELPLNLFTTPGSKVSLISYN